MSSSRHPSAVVPRVTLAAALIVGALALPARAVAISAPEAIAFLNQQRAANGLPGDLTESAALTEGCTKHNHYMALNGMGHGEDPSKSGYTLEGAAQGEYSYNGEVLAGGLIESWSARANPWGYFDRRDGTWGGATLHINGMVRPQNTLAGYAHSEGFSCMRFRRGRADPPAPQFFAYTTEEGRSNVPYAVRAAELPFTPADIAGLPPDQPTGPHLLLFAHGVASTERLEVAAASLIGPAGPVEIRTVEEANETGLFAGSRFHHGGAMIPVSPLSPSSHYEGQIVWRLASSGATLMQAFAFDTAPYLAPYRYTPPSSAPNWPPPPDFSDDPAASSGAPTCRRVLHRVRYRQRYRTASGQVRYRWRTKAHLHRHRHRYRDARGRLRTRLHWHRHYLRRCS